MPGLTTQPVVPIEEWLTESVRATVFPASGVVLAPDTWWRSVLGGDPETRTVKPALREHREEGAFGDGKLVLVVNPLGVVQWQLGAPDLTELPEGLPAAGPFVRRAAEFLDLMGRWFPMCPASNRVAYGAVALLPVGGHREGYERLGALLRTVKVDPLGSSDFLYRINRPRVSRSVPGLSINRLSSWSVIKMRVVAGMSGDPRNRFVNERYGCRVELDINTPAEHEGVFDSPQVAALFGEFHRLVVEILEMGDVE